MTTALTHLRPGNQLQISGVRLRITETIILTVDGFSWASHKVDGDPQTSWVTVEDDDGIQVTLWRDDPSLLASGEPGGRTLTVNGRKIRREERGTGTYRSIPSGESGAYEYLDYRDGGELVAFERFDNGPWEPASGRIVPNFAVQIVAEGD